MTAVTDDDRERHRARLELVIAERIVIEHARPARSTSANPPQGARLCAQCRGRCCAAGANRGAFIDLAVLQRWQQEQPAASLNDAIDAYLAMLPTEHVLGACLYQTATGCAIPRERRSDICNDFACEPLQEVQRAAAVDPVRAVLAITFHKDEIEAAAVIEAATTHALALAMPAPES